ncbi:MAG TPA: hydrogenase formation protein HypD, partial [Spirochaetota bacterium]|nr:hydrogenase formation protein HypD [Spirochaetota bacterium]
MKYLDEYRDSDITKTYIQAIKKISRKKKRLMEICGGQTHSIVKNGIDRLLADEVELIHGPGCPVCVTPAAVIDDAVNIAERENVIFCSFGDMLRVPGSKTNLIQARSRGADVRMVYSPLDALKIARENPEKEVVFFAIGFETTTFPNAATVQQAATKKIKNFSVLVSQVTVPPAVKTILDDPDSSIDGFLAAGHVCTVMGYEEYIPVSRQYNVPIVVTGFEPVDIVSAIYNCLKQLHNNEARVQNCYMRNVKKEGNKKARQLIASIFKPCDFNWRGIGLIPQSGMCLQPEFSCYNARKKFALAKTTAAAYSVCIS